MYALRHCDRKARLHFFSSGTMTVHGTCSRLTPGANNPCRQKCRVIGLDVAARSAQTERPRRAATVLILRGVYTGMRFLVAGGLHGRNGTFGSAILSQGAVCPQ